MSTMDVKLDAGIVENGKGKVPATADVDNDNANNNNNTVDLQSSFAAMSVKSLMPSSESSAPLIAAATACGVAATSQAAATASASRARTSSYIPPVCHYYLRGTCRFGPRCRFSHDAVVEAPAATATVTATITGADVASTSKAGSQEALNVNDTAEPKPAVASNGKIRADAPVFVPGAGGAAAAAAAATATVMSYAEVASLLGGTVTDDGVVVDNRSVCPYVPPCRFGGNCEYDIHLEMCGMCGDHCLNPSDVGQRRRHIQECLRRHEDNMELSFAVARSKDKKCGICFDTVVEKTGREKRFGILPNCNHTYCLECIRKWRQAPQFEHKITRSCPECRVCSDFVCPSAYWVDTKEEKQKLLTDYRAALNSKDCKYFKKGAGKCPFGNKCFYKHANRNGELVDVGCPRRRPRRLRRSSDEVMELLDLYLWDFVERRDYQWINLFDSDDDTDEEDDSSFYGSD